MVIKEVFGDRAKYVPISSIKSMVGECLDASAAMQIVSGVMALNNNIVPSNYKLRRTR